MLFTSALDAGIVGQAAGAMVYSRWMCSRVGLYDESELRINGRESLTSMAGGHPNNPKVNPSHLPVSRES